VIEENAVVVSDVQCIARNSPVVICRIKHIPSREPKFHHAEMLDSVGRSINEWLMIFINGCVFQMFVIRGFCS
jgi:hypothetical protein